MTTIVWDTEKLAADSLRISENLRSLMSEKKIFEPEDGDTWRINGDKVLAIGISSDGSVEKELINKLVDHIKYDTEFLKATNFEAIAVLEKKVDDSSTNHKAYLLIKNKGECHVSVYVQNENIAIGSGKICAKVAMSCGKDAEEAVKTAIEMDIYTGGKVTVFKP